MKKEFIFLKNYNNSVDALKFFLGTNDSVIVPASEVESAKFSTGFFEIEKRGGVTDITALVATPEGPLLILNAIQHFPKLGKTKIEVRDDEKSHHFLVFDDEKFLFGIFYEEKAGVGSNPYDENREDVDFYYWLSKNMENPKLYDFYRRNWVCLVD
jgi:hypothetical protein